MITKRYSLDEFEHAFPGCNGKIVADDAELVCTTCGATQHRLEKTAETRIAAGNGDARSYFALGTRTPRGITQFRPRYESWKSIRAAKLDEMIEMVSEPLGLSLSAKITAVRMGRKLLKGSTLRRASLRSICIYSVVQASRATGTHRTLDEILEAFKVESGDGSNKMFRELNKIVKVSSMEYLNASPEDYIKLIIKRLSRKSGSEEVYLRAVFRKACDVLIHVRSAVVGKNPWSIAAYCIYRADMELGYKVGLDVICEATRLTPERLSDLEEKIQQSLPGERRIEREAMDHASYDVYKAEAHTFKISLRRNR